MKSVIVLKPLLRRPSGLTEPKATSQTMSPHCLLAALLCAFTATQATLWEHSCPQMCICYVTGWRVLQLDAKTVNCDNTSLQHIPQNISSDAEVLVLRHNMLGYKHHLRLLDLIYLQRILLLDLSFNRIRTLRHSGGNLENLRYLNLSHNWLSKLEAGMFRSFFHVQMLNLRSNRIAFIAPLALELPKLIYLDMSNNRITSLQPHYFIELRQLRTVIMSNNHISRVSQIFYHHSAPVDLLNLERNRISKIDDDAFRYISKIVELNLAVNHLVEVPHAALATVPRIEKLMLNRNSFRVIASDSFQNVNVSDLDISHNSDLCMTEKDAFADMKHLVRMRITNNRKLKYLHHETINNTPLLRTVDLRNNSLIMLHEELFNSLQSLRTLLVSGNLFWCTCNIRWLQDWIKNSSSEWTVGSQNVSCIDGNATFQLDQLERLPSACPPQVLPLFPHVMQKRPTSDVKVKCVATGIPIPEVKWLFSDESCISCSCPSQQNCKGECELMLRYVQQENSGQYTCVASNALGNMSSSFNLHVKDLNIHIIPLTVASTFVTLSWNMSSFFNSNYVLQYREENGKKVFSKTIVLGLKVHSYTLSGLRPAQSYIIWLCLQRDSFIIRLSSLKVTTKDESYLLMLGIQTNYLCMVLITAAAGSLVISCLCACSYRLYKWQCRQHCEMVLSDSASRRCFAKSDSAHSDLAFMTYVNVADETVLVDQDEENFEY